MDLKKENDVLRRARDRQRRDTDTAILLGPAHIGKSQLLRDFAALLKDRPFTALTGLELEQRFPPPEGYEPPLSVRPEWRGRVALVLLDETESRS